MSSEENSSDESSQSINHAGKSDSSSGLHALNESTHSNPINVLDKELDEPDGTLNLAKAEKLIFGKDKVDLKNENKLTLEM